MFSIYELTLIYIVICRLRIDLLVVGHSDVGMGPVVVPVGDPLMVVADVVVDCFE